MGDSTNTPVCRLYGRYLAILGRPIRITVPAGTVAPMALVGSLISLSNLPHSLQVGGGGGTYLTDTLVYLFLFCKMLILCLFLLKYHHVSICLASDDQLCLLSRYRHTMTACPLTIPLTFSDQSIL